jgi:hypothetical protein
MEEIDLHVEVSVFCGGSPSPSPTDCVLHFHFLGGCSLRIEWSEGFGGVGLGDFIFIL